MIKSIFTCLFCTIFLSAFSQPTFKTRIFIGDLNQLSQVIQLNDGSYISIGKAYDISNQIEGGMLLVKTNIDGTVLASKAIGTVFGDEGYSVTKTIDGGFAISGILNGSMTLIKYKPDLTIEWQKNYSIESNNMQASKILQNKDGSYMVVGNTYDNAATRFTGYIIKTDSVGAIVYTRKYFLFSDYRIVDLVQTSDGNYAFLTYSDFTSSTPHMYIVKTKPDGSVIWSSSFNSETDFAELMALTASSDNGIVVTGGSGYYDNPIAFNLVMVKYSGNGSLAWSKKIITNQPSASIGSSVIENKDGSYIFGSYLQTFNESNLLDTTYLYAVKTDASGTLQWTKTFEPSTEYSTPAFLSIAHTQDGGYITCGNGYFNRQNTGSNNGSFIYKLNTNFEICSEVSGSQGTFQNAGSSIVVTTTATDVITTASNITVSMANAGIIEYPCSAFPLQLLSFTATIQNKSVTVNWTTANEINTNYFVVERSANGASFTALQQVAAKGNSSVTQMYSTTDLQPLQGTSYYRLKQVDKDGKTTYSPVASVTVMSNGSIVISPNPVQSTIHAVVQSAANSIATLQVVTMNGNVLATQKTALTTGRNVITVPAASLAKGVYVLKVIGSQSTEVIRFVKE